MTDRSRLFVELDTSMVPQFRANVYDHVDFVTPTGDTAYYGITLLTSCVAPLMTHQPGKDTYFVRSHYRPRVYNGDTPLPDLMEDLRKLDALNRSRDLVFRDQRLRLGLLQYEFTVTHCQMGKRLGIAVGESAKTVSLETVEFLERRGLARSVFDPSFVV